MSGLVTSEIFRLCFNTFTPDDKYSRCNMQTFWQKVQTVLSEKGETCFRSFIEFPKCARNLENSGRKQQSPNLIITEIIASERDVYLSV